MQDFNIIGTIELSFFAVGMIVLIAWLKKTSIGKTALADSPIKPNTLPIHFPFIFMFAWLTATVVLTQVALFFTTKESMAMYIIRILISLSFIAVSLFAMKNSFPAGLKGAGLDIKTLPRDFVAAVLNVIAIRPVMIAGSSIIVFFGILIYGTAFEFQTHQSLSTITQCDSTIQIIIMILMITVITPIFEELMFRGLIQTALTRHLANPWQSILLSSMLFTVLHGIPAHWLALLPLSMCIGYAYQKSGSLFRPIFIHIIFNSINTACSLALS